MAQEAPMEEHRLAGADSDIRENKVDEEHTLTGVLGLDAGIWTRAGSQD